MTHVIGAMPTTIFSATEATQGKGFGLGDRYSDHLGNEYVYCVAGGTITAAGYVCIIDDAANAYSATMLSTSNDAANLKVGLAPGAMVSTDRGWFQVFGVCSVRVLASAVANTRLNTTATAGALDDDGTAGSFAVLGLTITTTNGGSAATVVGHANYPTLSLIAL